MQKYEVKGIDEFFSFLEKLGIEVKKEEKGNDCYLSFFNKSDNTPLHVFNEDNRSITLEELLSRNYIILYTDEGFIRIHYEYLLMSRYDNLVVKKVQFSDNNCSYNINLVSQNGIDTKLNIHTFAYNSNSVKISFTNRFIDYKIGKKQGGYQDGNYIYNSSLTSQELIENFVSHEKLISLVDACIDYYKKYYPALIENISSFRWNAYVVSVGKKLFSKVIELVKKNKNDDDLRYIEAFLISPIGVRVEVPFTLDDIHIKYRIIDKTTGNSCICSFVVANNDNGAINSVFMIHAEDCYILPFDEKRIYRNELSDYQLDLIKDSIQLLKKQIPLLSYDKESTYFSDNLQPDYQRTFEISLFDSKMAELKEIDPNCDVFPEVVEGVDWFVDRMEFKNHDDSKIEIFKKCFQRKIMKSLENGDDYRFIGDIRDRILNEVIIETNSSLLTWPEYLSMDISVDYLITNDSRDYCEKDSVFKIIK